MEMRRFGLMDFIGLLVVLAGAAGARFWYLSDPAENATRTPVQVQADPLPDLKEPTADTSPGYPALVSLAAENIDDWQSVVRWAQCGLGTLTAGFYFLFARRAFRSLFVGTLAGLFCAFYPFWIINTAELNDGVLTTFLLAACLFLAARASQAGGAGSSLLYGLGLAGLSLVRAALLPFAVVALLWFLLRCRRLKRGWLYALLAFLGFVNGLVPWTMRNFQTEGDLIPIVNSTYWHLWVGNHPSADGGPIDQAAGEANRRAALPTKPAPARRYDDLAHEVVDNVRDDPGAAVQRRISAGLYFVFGADWFRKHHTICAGDQDYADLLTGVLLGMLLLAFLGWRWTYGWRRLSMPSSLAVIWIPLPYFLGHAEALSGPRLPLDGVLLCYAAVALTCLLPRIGWFMLQGPDVVGD
jgi:hypothetical protein